VENLTDNVPPATEVIPAGHAPLTAEDELEADKPNISIGLAD
jgi:hypothetical protein